MPGIVNESDVVSDLAALADGVMSQNVATGYLKDVSPEDARRLDGVSAFSLRSMICPGEPEVNYVFAGDSSFALVDFSDNQPSTRRNVGEYIKERPELLPGAKPMVWHSLRWGRGLPDIITGVEQSLENLKPRGTSRPAIVVVAFAGNDIFGNHGFVGCEWLQKERQAHDQTRRWEHRPCHALVWQGLRAPSRLRPPDESSQAWLMCLGCYVHDQVHNTPISTTGSRASDSLHRPVHWAITCFAFALARVSWSLPQ